MQPHLIKNSWLNYSCKNKLIKKSEAAAFQIAARFDPGAFH